MKSGELSSEVMNQSKEMVKMTLADFSDADMLARPCPGANHAAWQLGHLIGAETRIVNSCTPGAMPELPAGFADKFSKSTASSDDAAAFPKKAELMALFEKTRGAAMEWARKLSDEDLNKPVEGPAKSFAPTVYHATALIPNHTMMHLGQFQVIRRKLGKPVLF
jgi:hypothetical protein